MTREDDELCNDLRCGLSPEQWAAVDYDGGPQLVLSGAGSGKTRVLTYKIACLLRRGVPRENILALTFTNKAAREMKQRIESLLGGEMARGVWAGTFHSIFARILRREAPLLGYTSHFVIYDTADSASLVKAIVKQWQLDDKQYKPKAVLGRISEAKNCGLTAGEYLGSAAALERDRLAGLGETGRIYEEYQRRLRGADAMDFDDLLLNFHTLLREHSECAAHWKRRFTHILVDEYQDTNRLQDSIIGQLTGPDSHLCVVGDDAQSIYAFRGARIENILQLQQRYPHLQTTKLERNYRSTQTIVNAASSVLSHNHVKLPKEAYSKEAVGEPVRLSQLHSDKEEAIEVARQATALHREGEGWEQMAVLYRTHAQSRQLEEALRGAGVPFRIWGGLSFYQRKEVKDVLAYLRLCVNQNDEEAFKRVVNYPSRGIGATTMGKLQAAAADGQASLFQLAQEPARYGVQLGRGAVEKLRRFTSLILGFASVMAETDAASLAVRVVRESGIGSDLCSLGDPENKTRRENVDELLGAIKAAVDERLEQSGERLVLEDWLQDVALLTDADEPDDGNARMLLMTMHAAKGLEFNTVFITGMEADLFPSADARFSPTAMEEERRLFYVALTRAKSRVYLSYAQSRYRYGQMDFPEPSQFLREIDPQYVVVPAARPLGGSMSTERRRGGAGRVTDGGVCRTPYAPASRTPYALRCRGGGMPRPPSSCIMHHAAPTPVDRQTSAGQTWRVGERVLHPRFGAGRLLSVEGSGAMAKVAVDFDSVGPKNLLLKFAKLEKL